MSDRSKAAERTTLIMELGRLLAELDDLAERPTPPSPTDYRIAAARVHPDLQRWMGKAGEFVIVDGYRFGHVLDDILNGPRGVFHMLGVWGRDVASDPASRQKELGHLLEATKGRTREAIDAIPLDWNPHLSAERTPFATYLNIRDAVLTAKTRLHYFDRYVDADFFPLYLRDVPRSVQIRVVTTAGKSTFGVAAIASVSKLASAEFADYQLVQVDPCDLHDRNLRVDDRIFSLGSSIKDAGRYPTNFSPGDSSQHGHQVLDTIMAKGRVVQ